MAAGQKGPRAWKEGAATRRVTILPATIITTAVTGVVTTPIVGLEGMRDVVAEAIFVYGTAGTTVKGWLQTSLDAGVTWIDIIAFAFTVASAKKVSKVSIVIALAAAYVPTDATLADDTIKDGLLGDRLRLKYTSTGTYATSTTLEVHATVKG